MSNPQIGVPVLQFDDGSGGAQAVSQIAPLPVEHTHAAASSTPLIGTASASTTTSAFVPDLARAIWVRLSGTWAGTVQLQRSIDGGTTWFGLTTSTGTVKAAWTGNVNAPIIEETVSGATYCLVITLTSGSVSYEVNQ